MNATFKDDDAVTVEDGRKRLGELVKSRRAAAYGTIEAAIRAAGVNRQTWERVEAGERVWNAKLAQIVSAVGLPREIASHFIDTGEGFDALEKAPLPSQEHPAIVFDVEPPRARRKIERIDGEDPAWLGQLPDAALLAAIRAVTTADNLTPEVQLNAIRRLLDLNRSNDA